MQAAETRFFYHSTEIRLFHFGEADHIARHIMTHQAFYEQDLLECACEIYKPGTVIIDAGAYIGNHSVFFAKILGAEVFAFEPYAPAFDLLRKNAEANNVSRQFHFHSQALGASPGKGDSQILAQENLGRNRFVSSATGRQEMTALDELSITQPVGLIKIDVEKAEMDVLKGAEKLIQRDRPFLFVEAMDEEAHGQLAGWADAHQYEIRGRYCATPTYLLAAKA